jgi:hypothetical protein
MELTEVHGRIHHEIIAAAGNDHLLNAYARCEEEMRVLLAVLRPDFFTRRLLQALHRAEAAARAIGARPATS